MSCRECSCNMYPRLKSAPTNTNQKIMVIGEMPTPGEVARCEIFTGGSADVLKQVMKKVGLPTDHGSVYYTTALKCAIPKKKGKKIPSDAPLLCGAYLHAEIREVKPQLVLVCGSVAMQTLIGHSKFKITELYGRVFEFPVLSAAVPGIKIIPIMNPGVLIHNPNDYKPFLAMMQVAASTYKGEEAVDSGETTWTVADKPERCKELYDWMVELNDKHIKETGEPMVVAFDIETTGLDYRSVDFLVCGINYERNHTWIIPREMRHVLHNFISKELRI